MRRVLVLFAHPVMERSRVNKRLVDALRDLDGVTIHDLYEAYPTFAIDVAREQELLAEHDVIVFQHPFYWYSSPAILKEWQDLVLQHGWAYGEGGTALAGKVTLNAISTGGPAAAYAREGYNRFTVRELLAPWEQTANLCRMRFLAPYVVHAALRVGPEEDLGDRRAAYRRLVEGLRDGRIDLERAQRAQNLLDELDDLFAAAVLA
jgi:glutathione-regulated potassium-efflux system ancillary protein KefG